MRKWIFIIIYCYLTFIQSNVIAAANQPADTAKQNLEKSRRAGAMVAIHNCMMCHDIKYIRYRDLMDLGLSLKEVDRLRTVNKIEQPLMSPMSMESAKQLFGLVPPDLSLITKARKGGAHYVNAMLTAYEINDEGTVINQRYPGINMPDVLAYSIEKDEARRKELQIKALDVSNFLAWAADPAIDERRNLGTYVLIYLVILTLLLYWLKRRIWNTVK